MDLNDPVLQPLPTKPDETSDIEDGEIPNTDNRSSPTLKKKTPKKLKAKDLNGKRQDPEKVGSHSSKSEAGSGDDDSDDGWWCKKKHHMDDNRAQMHHKRLGEEEPAEKMEEEVNSGFLKRKNSYKQDSHFKPKKFQGRGHKHRESSPSSEGSADKTQLYPCKSYIAYGKCGDPACRYVHAPLTRVKEIERFISENEDFFHDVFKKIPTLTLPPPLLKGLIDKFGPPPSLPSPVNNTPSPIPRPMPPPKFFAPQGPYPLSPNPSFPVFGAPQYFPQPTMNPYYNMTPTVNPMGINVPVPPMLNPMSAYPTQPFMQNFPVISPMQDPRLISTFNQMGNMGNVGHSYLGFPHTGNMGQDMQAQAYPVNQVNPVNPVNVVTPVNNETHMSPEKPRKENNKEESQIRNGSEGGGSSRSSPSSGTKEVREELDNMTKSQMVGEKAMQAKKNISADLQSQETDSTTPESRANKEEEMKKPSTIDQIAKLVELSRLKKLKKKGEENKNVSAQENVQTKLPTVVPQSSESEAVQAVVSDPIYQEEPRVKDNKEVPECENDKEREKIDEPVEKKEEEVKDGSEQAEDKEDEKKSVYENVSVNEILLKQIKSALPQTQSQSAETVKNLVNMYLKLSKSAALH